MAPWPLRTHCCPIALGKCQNGMISCLVWAPKVEQEMASMGHFFSQPHSYKGTILEDLASCCSVRKTEVEEPRCLNAKDLETLEWTFFFSGVSPWVCGLSSYEKQHWPGEFGPRLCANTCGPSLWEWAQCPGVISIRHGTNPTFIGSVQGDVAKLPTWVLVIEPSHMSAFLLVPYHWQMHLFGIWTEKQG